MTLEEKVIELEATIADLRERLEKAETIASIKRGLADADAGRVIPAREWAEKVRKKHNLPRSS